MEKNIFKENIKEINPFLRKLKKQEWVVGIALLGGLGKRKFVDKFSDIDLSILVHKKDKENCIFPFEFHYNTGKRELEFNIHQLILEEELNKVWDEGKKEAYSKAAVYFDKYGEFKKLIKDKIKYDEKEAYKRLIWIIQQYRWRGQIHSIRAVIRGYPESGHSLVNESIDLLVEALYILNKRYLPHRKWRIPYLNEMENAKEIIPLIKKAIIVNKNNIMDIKRRINITDKIYQKVYSLVLEKYPAFPKETYEYYYKNFVQLNPETKIDKLLKKLNPSKEELEKVKGILCYNIVCSNEKLLNSLFHNNNIIKGKKPRNKYKNDIGGYSRYGS